MGIPRMAQGISCEGRCGLRPELDFRGMGESAFGGWCRDRHVPLSGRLSGGTRSLVLDREPALSGRRKGLWSAVLLTILIPAWLGCPRELGTTYGMRAQDAIGWMPRRFRFLSTVEQWKRARELYGTVMPGARCGAGSDVADRKLLETVGGPGVGYGEFAVEDARLVAGVGDPPAFARQWAANLERLPHTLVQSEGPSGDAGMPLGALKWIRFHAEPTFPKGWKLPSGLGGKATSCAE